MELVKLPPRLALIADLVPDGARLVDVGTDHGLVPIRLLQERRIRSAVASDIRSGPLSRAKANAAAHDVENIRFVLCDGLADISPDEADTIVIAGMGGETIAAILEAAPWSQKGRTLILQPMSRPEILREALRKMSLRIEIERLVEDSGKIYTVLLAQRGEPHALSEAEMYIGPYAMLAEQELFLPFLRQWEQKTHFAIQGLKRSSKPEDEKRLIHLKTVYEQLRQMRERGESYAVRCGDRGVSGKTDTACPERGL